MRTPSFVVSSLQLAALLSCRENSTTNISQLGNWPPQPECHAMSVRNILLIILIIALLGGFSGIGGGPFYGTGYYGGGGLGLVLVIVLILILLGRL